MNKITIISSNNELKERFKEFLSPENYLVSFLKPEELTESSGSVILLDLISLQDLRSKNLKKLFEIQTTPMIVIINEQLIENFSFFTGADEFILDKISQKELSLRIKQILWKTYGIDNEDTIQIKGIIIDLAQHKVLINMEPVILTYMEFKLLQFLVSNKNRVFSRNHILERVWGYDYFGGARTVDVHIRRLRYKLGAKYGQYVETVRNVGYKFNDEVT